MIQTRKQIELWIKGPVKGQKVHIVFAKDSQDFSTWLKQLDKVRTKTVDSLLATKQSQGLLDRDSVLYSVPDSSSLLFKRKSKSLTDLLNTDTYESFEPNDRLLARHSSGTPSTASDQAYEPVETQKTLQADVKLDFLMSYLKGIQD